MRWAFVRFAFPAVISCSTASCYFLSSFDGLQGGSSSSTVSGQGGSASPGSSTTTTSTTQTTSTQGSSASSAVGGGGSGGGAGGSGTESCPLPGIDYTGLVLNELAPKGLPDDWIEIRNNGLKPIPLCGVILTQDYDDITVPTGPDRFTFGEITLAPGKYVVIAAGAELPFGLAKDAPERITLFTPGGVVLDDASWIASQTTEFTPFESWARIPDATGPFKRANNPTKGTSNFEMGGAGGAGGSSVDAGSDAGGGA